MDISPTSYKILTDGLLDKLKSSGLPTITEEELSDMLNVYIRPACVKFKACKQDLTDRDDEELSFNIELTDEEIEIITHLMLVEYLTANYLNVPSLLKQSLVSKDFKVFSSSEHILRLTGLRDSYRNEVRQMISTYSILDSSLFDMLKLMSETQDSSSGDDVEEEII